MAYLLSFSHPDGKSKAVFFSSFGFSASRWEELALALRQHAAMNDVTEVESTAYGTKYVVEGPLLTPDGRNPEVRVVWFIERGDTTAHLVTAYPRP